MEELPDGPHWHLEELSSRWEILPGPSDALWALHFWSLDKGLAAPSWWSWSGPQAAPVPQADGKPWSSPTHLQSYLEPEEMVLEWLTSGATHQTIVLAVKRVVLWPGTWGRGLGSQCKWPFCLEPPASCLVTSVSHSVQPLVQLCQTTQGGSFRLERNTFQVDMRVNGLKTSLYENISLSLKITSLHIQFAAHWTMWIF